MALVKQVLCNIGGGLYGIDIAYVKEIEKYQNIIPVPNEPSYIEGIINLRGEVVPVFNLRDKFHQPKAAVTDNTKLIITTTNDLMIAFIVDGISEIVEIAEEQFMKTPVIVQNEETTYIQSIAQVDRKLVIVLNLDGILTEKQQKKIETLIEEHG